MAIRILSFFLSAYVLLLTLTPCVDEDVRCTEERHEHIAMNGTSSHQEAQDCCSPFCTCSCCSLPCELVNPYLLSSTYIPLQTIVSFLEPQFESCYIFSIWEPPKA